MKVTVPVTPVELILHLIYKCRNQGINMEFKDLKFLWYADLYRYDKLTSFNKSVVLRNLVIRPGFRYTFFMRLCCYLKDVGSPLKKIVFYTSLFLLHHYGTKFSIEIHYETKIGTGFFIGHYGRVIINERSEIGKNCNISHDVTIGQTNRGPKAGCPKIGNYVYIGPGAKIIGAVKIGDHAAIGANAVVTKDVPDNAVVVGVPAKIVSYNGSEGYVLNTDY